MNKGVAATASIGVPESAIRQQNEFGRYAMRTISDSLVTNSELAHLSP
jgi:hypothetical protein